MKDVSKLPLTPEGFADIRNALALTLDEMAKLLGVDRRTVSRWEADEREIPKPTQMLVILMDTQPEVYRLVQRLSAGLSVGAASSDAPAPKKKVEVRPGDRARKLHAAVMKMRELLQPKTQRDMHISAMVDNQCHGHKTWLKSDEELTDALFFNVRDEPILDGPPPSRDELLAMFALRRKAVEHSEMVKKVMLEFDDADYEYWHGE